mmetsp:Transcript_34593/g.83665  ORF Transcript_34593/g.83665 Transcript_34593/m.83665 type:complete len:101 (+) Transcript_34593:431-733(+)
MEPTRRPTDFANDPRTIIRVIMPRTTATANPHSMTPRIAVVKRAFEINSSRGEITLRPIPSDDDSDDGTLSGAGGALSGQHRSLKQSSTMAREGKRTSLQ